MKLKASVVLVTGDRNWEDTKAIESVLRSIAVLELVIQGGAKGADNLAANASHKLEIPYITIPAKWRVHHKAAGPIRNRVMLNWIGSDFPDLDCDAPRLVVGFHNNIQKSKGTKDMLNAAHKAGIKTVLVQTDESKAKGYRIVHWPLRNSK